ncbi:MAG: glycosyltransferase family 1 protein [Granulosicoccaceae bacterium]|jgi:glycosyltransferase involved in cell wall biosynthesis
MKIVIATDAWTPQTNGVVTTLSKTAAVLRDEGNTVEFVTPAEFKTVPLPSYPSIRLALWPYRKISGRLDDFCPDAIHIATEGPIGSATQRYCLKHGLPFTTSYHTQFPEYIRLRLPLPIWLSYFFLRRFHSKAKRTMVPSQSMRERLEKRGFSNVVVWGRGVDADLFVPDDKKLLEDKRPVFIYIGRVAVEKNIEAFLQLDLPGTKYVVGDGPDMQMLQKKYPDAVYTGFLYGHELAKHLAAADVFVFPSLTDTFGVVMLEAMACAVPVAAFPVTGPKDVVIDGVTGCLNSDLKQAALDALHLDPARARAYALEHSWQACTRQFFGHLERIQREPVSELNCRAKNHVLDNKE